jgi:hypothetical protein
MAFNPLREADIADEEEEVRKLVATQQPSTVDLADEYYGPAFRRYLLFSKWSHLLSGKGLDERALFHNAYYWFRVFIKRHMATHGYDAGLEQQAFNILERAKGDIDWSIIEQINRQVDKEA